MRYLILLICVFLFSCNTWKESLVKEGDKEDAIQNAILDFTHSKKLFSQDSVFYVIVQDTLYSLKLESESEYAHRWVKDKPYSDIIGVSIVGDHFNTYYEEEFQDENSGVPTRYLIVEDKLFLWWDETHPLTKEVIDALYQFNLVVSKDEAMFVTNHNKSAKYYFCRNNLSQYKRIVSRSAIGYDVPKLKCPK